jgi:cyclophilin family peptidyl-prolyl cis-trans isomerase
LYPSSQVAKTPKEIAASAPAADWVRIPQSDLLVMDFEADGSGVRRRVVLQLVPPPFSQGWASNVRSLARAQWWDGTTINRVQDNYVVQWGDATAQKALPEGLVTMRSDDYCAPFAPHCIHHGPFIATNDDRGSVDRWHLRDAYAPHVSFWCGWPVGTDFKTMWPIHCYGMLGVGHELPPDTGSGAELYTVIGHAPRHLDRNTALVGRVIEGIEYLSAIPRGNGPAGYIDKAEHRLGITSIRLASDLPSIDELQFEYLSTDCASFQQYVDACANRKDPFFICPADGVDICNIVVPIRRTQLLLP